jgi:hypothetical protein
MAIGQRKRKTSPCNQPLLDFWLATQVESHGVSSCTLSKVPQIGNRPGQHYSPPELCGTFASNEFAPIRMTNKLHPASLLDPPLGRLFRVRFPPVKGE